MVIAILQCHRQKGRRHQARFKKREFTELGNYREFLTRQIVVEGAEKIAKAKASRLLRRRRSWPKRRGAPTSDVLSRTAIKLKVK